MKIKFDELELTVTQSGTFFELDEYVNFKDFYASAVVTNDDGTTTTYTNVQVVCPHFSGDQYYIGFREIPEEEIVQQTNSTIAKLENVLGIFADWAVGVAYKTGNRLIYNKSLYKVLQDHTSQSDWTPDKTPSLYVKVIGATATDDGEVTVEEYPEWVQPTGATDAYAKGAKVSHNDKHYISAVENNVYEPGVAGWTEVTDNDDSTKTIAEFVQPTGASDAYQTGDKVTFNGSTYESTIDNNVWSPTAYPAGWKLVE